VKRTIDDTGCQRLWTYSKHSRFQQSATEI